MSPLLTSEFIWAPNNRHVFLDDASVTSSRRAALTGTRRFFYFCVGSSYTDLNQRKFPHLLPHPHKCVSRWIKTIKQPVHNASGPLQIVSSVNLFVREPCWGFLNALFFSTIHRTTLLLLPRAFSRPNTTTWLVNRGALCLSVAGGKLLVHTAVCGVVFFYSGSGFVSGQRRAVSFQ